MNYRTISCLILVVTIEFLNSIQAKSQIENFNYEHSGNKKIPQEGTKSEKCKSAEYVLIDSCGSYCSCLKGEILAVCKEKKCKKGEEPPYSPVDDYEVVMEPHKSKLPETCKPGTTAFDGCSNCFCHDGKFACTLIGCYHPVYRKKEK